MNLFNIPGLDGWKTHIGGWGLTIIGVATVVFKLGELILLVGQCLAGQAEFSACIDQLPVLTAGLLSSFGGISVLGIGHKAQWIIEMLEKKHA